MFQTVNQKCPKAKLMFMGYSQGGALMTNVIPQLSPEIKSQIIGGVLFGSTRGTIAGISKDVWTAYCATDDRVCNSRGNTGGTGSHMSYSSNGDVAKAVQFLGKKIEAAAGK
jgi:cutinase